MELLAIICLIVQPASNVNWNPKEIQLPGDASRVTFPFFVPQDKQELKVGKILLVWIPRVDAFPDMPARQALRMTLISRDGKIVELIQTPTSHSTAWGTVSHVIGQGYVGLKWHKGMTSVAQVTGSISVGLTSVDYDTAGLQEILKGLRRYAPKSS